MNAGADIEAAIAEIHRGIRAAVRSRDETALVSFFAEDAQLLPPEGHIVRGRDGMLAFARDGFAGGLTDLLSSSADVRADERLAVEVGHSTFVIAGEGGLTEVKARYLMVYARQPDRSWRISHDSWTFLNE